MASSTFGANLKSVLSLAVPLALTQLSQHSMSFVDTMFIGRVGEVDLAATALGSSLFFTTCIIGFGILHGLDTIISQAFGATQPEKARNALIQGTYLAFIWSFFSALAAWFITYSTRFIGTELRVAEGALEYMEGRLPSILPMFLISKTIKFHISLSLVYFVIYFLQPWTYSLSKLRLAIVYTIFYLI